MIILMIVTKNYLNNRLVIVSSLHATMLVIANFDVNKRCHCEKKHNAI